MKKSLFVLGSVFLMLLVNGGTVGKNNQKTMTKVDRVNYVENEEPSFQKEEIHYLDDKCLISANTTIYLPSPTNNDVDLGFSDIVDEFKVEMTYEITIDKNIGSISIKAISNTENLIEDFLGYITKRNDSWDIAFWLNDGLVYASELIETYNSMECGWWDDTVRNSEMTALRAGAAVTPAALLALSASPSWGAWIVSSASSVMLENYVQNKLQTQPVGLITNQNIYGSWAYLTSSLSATGCGIIATYNAMHDVYNSDITLPDTILAFEILGINISLSGGWLGSNPLEIAYFFNSRFVNYQKIESFDDFVKKESQSIKGKFIFSRWNDEYWNSAIHTFYIEKKNNSTYITYN